MPTTLHKIHQQYEYLPLQAYLLYHTRRSFGKWPIGSVTSLGHAKAGLQTGRLHDGYSGGRLWVDLPKKPQFAAPFAIGEQVRGVPGGLASTFRVRLPKGAKLQLPWVFRGF